MKKIVIIALSILFLASIGGGSVILLNPSFAASDEAKKGDEEQVSSTKKDSGDLDYNNMLYVLIDPIMIPVVGRRGVEQMVTISIVLEVEGAYTSANVRSYIPRLADAYMTNMYDFLTSYAYSDEKLIKVSALKDLLTKITHNVVGEGMVNDVLIQNIQQRPI